MQSWGEGVWRDWGSGSSSSLQDPREEGGREEQQEAGLKPL